MTKTSRGGLLWDDTGLNFEPRWPAEPNLDAIKAVCLRTLKIGPDDCMVTFLAAGAFYKLYLVESKSQQKLVMRVSLPVDPQHKVTGEVATLRWIRRFTKIPVPEIIAFDDSSDNEIGFEWILMQLMPGTSAYSRWRKMSFTKKKALAEQIAKATQHTTSFRGIGTLHHASQGDDGTDATSLVPGRIVSRQFFSGQHFDYDIARGPFRSSYDWLDSCIKIIIKEQQAVAEEEEEEEQKADAEYWQKVASRLAALLPKIFPVIQNPPERTVLWHDDLSLSNILVDDEGAITAVIDWECVSTMPYWVATEMPGFLIGTQREQEPIRDDYGDESPEEAEAARIEDGDDYLDNEGKDELYWIHLMEHEQTLLRKAYMDRMRVVWPSWDTEVADGALKVDFLGAVDRCAFGFDLKGLERWIDAIERGEFSTLQDILEPALT
ncbi:hypothetical protein QQX98_002117 [Neonectria punicea]|uniref:Aminoglycoside phosphotransferase domain-containing protein n=1 Tax=Neonectria punicea TaxID=979145 RepID=A0ABR1HKD0_9HYPO